MTYSWSWPVSLELKLWSSRAFLHPGLRLCFLCVLKLQASALFFNVKTTAVEEPSLRSPWAQRKGSWVLVKVTQILWASVYHLYKQIHYLLMSLPTLECWNSVESVTLVSSVVGKASTKQHWEGTKSHRAGWVGASSTKVVETWAWFWRTATLRQVGKSWGRGCHTGEQTVSIGVQGELMN